MKKNRMMRLASLLLVCVLLTTSVISGTFAKYTTSITATDTARVAKFAVSAFGTDAVTNDTADVKIFDESKVFDTKDADYANGVVDADIEDGTDVAIIAPGSWGTFNFDVENNSEVTVAYYVDYTVDEAGVPLEWSLDGATWTDDLADISADAAVTVAMNNTDNVAIYWRWIFNGDDDVDTDLGTADPLATPSVKIDVTIVQVD